MKKILLCILSVFLFITTACGNNSSSESITDIPKGCDDPLPYYIEVTVTEYTATYVFIGELTNDCPNDEGIILNKGDKIVIDYSDTKTIYDLREYHKQNPDIELFDIDPELYYKYETDKADTGAKATLHIFLDDLILDSETGMYHVKDGLDKIILY